MKRLILIAAMLLALVGCKTKTVVITVPEVRTDTVLVTKSQRDSIWLHDSIYVSEKTEGDTVWIKVSKWQTKYVEKEVHDTTYISTHDTIPQPYPVEVIKYVEKKLSWWQQSLMGLGCITAVALVLFLSIKILQRKL